MSTTQHTPQTKKRSKKYQANLAVIKKLTDIKPVTDIEEAVTVLFDLDQPAYKNGPMVEFHAKLSINPTKSDQLIRASYIPPHGVGKSVSIAAFVPAELEEEARKAGAEFVGSDELIEEIKKTGKINFDKAVAHPEIMKKLPAIARLLGTAGVMPNPKTGTVGENIAEIIGIIKAGKIDFKNDKTANIHIPVGRINKDFTVQKVVENITALMDSLDKSKPEGVKKALIVRAYLSTSLSPSIRIK